MIFQFDINFLKYMVFLFTFSQNEPSHQKDKDLKNTQTVYLKNFSLKYISLKNIVFLFTF